LSNIPHIHLDSELRNKPLLLKHNGTDLLFQLKPNRPCDYVIMKRFRQTRDKTLNMASVSV